MNAHTYMRMYIYIVHVFMYVRIYAHTLLKTMDICTFEKGCFDICMYFLKEKGGRGMTFFFFFFFFEKWDAKILKNRMNMMVFKKCLIICIWKNVCIFGEKVFFSKKFICDFMKTSAHTCVYTYVYQYKG